MNTAEYVRTMLDRNYEKTETLKKSFDTTVLHYRHKATGKDLIVIESVNANDFAYKNLIGLTSRHLPRVYDVYSTPEKLIVLEEYVPGETLEQVLRREKLSGKAAVGYLLELCDAVDILHSRGIIHRDIKPSNIILSPDGLKLIDFSIARLMREGRKSDTVPLGSVGYAAPEQFGISQSGPATDIYAIGVLFNELLTGRHPTEGVAPGRAGKIISRCLQIEKQKRYKSVAQLRAEIKTVRAVH
jgi:serine/threonine protein kinase